MIRHAPVAMASYAAVMLVFCRSTMSMHVSFGKGNPAWIGSKSITFKTGETMGNIRSRIVQRAPVAVASYAAVLFVSNFPCMPISCAIIAPILVKGTSMIIEVSGAERGHALFAQKSIRWTRNIGMG